MADESGPNRQVRVAPVVVHIQDGYDISGLHQVLSGRGPGQVWACTAHEDVLRCPVEWHADSVAELVVRVQVHADERLSTAEGLLVPFIVVLDAQVTDEIATDLEWLCNHPALSLVLMDIS